MNCSLGTDRLPALLYGDLPPHEAAELGIHLAQCTACRHEYVALTEVRGLLDAVPAPRGVRVDLPALYRREADLARRRGRNWRWAALTGLGAAAALVLLTLGLNLEIRFQAQQVVIRWGALPPPPEGPPAPTDPQGVVPGSAATEIRNSPAPPIEFGEKLRLLNEIAQAMATDAEARDARFQENLARLESRLQELQRLTNQRWTDTQRDVSALYAAQFVLPKKGISP